MLSPTWKSEEKYRRIPLKSLRVSPFIPGQAQHHSRENSPFTCLNPAKNNAWLPSLFRPPQGSLQVSFSEALFLFPLGDQSALQAGTVCTRLSFLGSISLKLPPIIAMKTPLVCGVTKIIMFTFIPY